MAEHDKTLRIISTLQLLTDRAYRTADDIQKRLEQQGYRVGKRTVERDLQTLFENAMLGAHIECNDRAKPYGWRMKPSAGMLLPNLDIDLAATWDLVGHYLEHLLPDSARHKLSTEINRSRKYLDQQTGNTWNQKVAFLPRGLLTPASIQPSVRETVYDALVEGAQIEARYRNKKGEIKEVRLHPLGVVHRVSVSYLVALWNDYDDPRHMALHRIERASKSGEKARTLPDFQLHEHINSGVFDISAGESSECILKLRFYHGAGAHLKESPLEKNQSIRPIDEQTLELTATTHDSHELRWWILGFGANVEVVEPPALREAIAEQVREAAERYA